MTSSCIDLSNTPLTYDKVLGWSVPARARTFTVHALSDCHAQQGRQWKGRVALCRARAQGRCCNRTGSLRNHVHLEHMSPSNYVITIAVIPVNAHILKICHLDDIRGIIREAMVAIPRFEMKYMAKKSIHSNLCVARTSRAGYSGSYAWQAGDRLQWP